jgi:hypothetical protein
LSRIIWTITWDIGNDRPLRSVQFAQLPVGNDKPASPRFDFNLLQSRFSVTSRLARRMVLDLLEKTRDLALRRLTIKTNASWKCLGVRAIFSRQVKNS